MSHADIQILHVAGCANLVRARQIVREGVQRAGLAATATVEEIEGEFASPTVLIGGLDVTGQEMVRGSACRIDLPTVDQVVSALSRSVSGEGGGRARRAVRRR